jgi:hypothetical protein
MIFLRVSLKVIIKKTVATYKDWSRRFECRRNVWAFSRDTWRYLGARANGRNRKVRDRNVRKPKCPKSKYLKLHIKSKTKMYETKMSDSPMSETPKYPKPVSTGLCVFWTFWFQTFCPSADTCSTWFTWIRISLLMLLNQICIPNVKNMWLSGPKWKSNVFACSRWAVKVEVNNAVAIMYFEVK